MEFKLLGADVLFQFLCTLLSWISFQIVMQISFE